MQTVCLEQFGQGGTNCHQKGCLESPVVNLFMKWRVLSCVSMAHSQEWLVLHLVELHHVDASVWCLCHVCEFTCET